MISLYRFHQVHVTSSHWPSLAICTSSRVNRMNRTNTSDQSNIYVDFYESRCIILLFYSYVILQVLHSSGRIRQNNQNENSYIILQISYSLERQFSQTTIDCVHPFFYFVVMDARPGVSVDLIDMLEDYIARNLLINVAMSRCSSNFA